MSGFSECGERDDVLAELLAALAALPSPQTAPLRSLRRAFSRRLARCPAAFILDLSFALLERGSFVHRFVAYELVSHHAAALRGVGREELERLGAGKDFLDEHARSLPARVIREVGNKLATGLKNPPKHR
jgi:hypothetical protein